MNSETPAQKLEKIPAKLLATGDIVHFPRIGARRALFIVASNWLSVSFRFDDGQLRTLENEQLLTVERATDTPMVKPGEVERLDRVSNRVSLTLPVLLSHFSDVRDAVCTKDCAFPSTVLRQELQRRNATVFTSKAIYRMPSGPAENIFEYRRAA